METLKNGLAEPNARYLTDRERRTLFVILAGVVFKPVEKCRKK